MKKVILYSVLLTVLAISFLFGQKTNKVYALSYRCTSFIPSCVIGGSFCRSSGFNCSNVVELPKQECELHGGCYEVISCGGTNLTNQCFQPASATPIPTECGYLGRRCCGDQEEGWTCRPQQGNPVEDFMNCTCQEFAPVVFCKDDEKCLACTNGTREYEGKGRGAWTAIGCIPTSDLNSFAGWIFPKVIGIASGIAFLLMVFGTFQIITSSGDPKKKQAGSELITSALSGLLFIILSIFLLKLIGVDILKIPGFGI